jgi:predicted glutamine amidotransferase
MCIAILNTKGTTLKKDILRNCWENNGDGAGLLYITDDKKLETFKEMKSFDSFYDKYIEVRKKYGKRNIVLHFRISTHGKINETNCHPFLVDDNVGFVHNGMIYSVPTSTDYSDTYMFNELILKNLKQGFENEDAILDMLADYIGNGSKLIFLNKNNEWSIVNESAGHWHLGCWFSNTSYKQVNNWYDFGGVKKYKSTSNYGATKTTYREESPKGYLWSSDSLEDCQCGSCDMVLYGVKEMEDGLCAWCKEEELAMASVSDCEVCEVKEGKFNVNWNAHICTDCTDKLGA